MADLVKKPDLEFSAQLSTFAKKLPTYATVLNLTPAEVGAAQIDADLMAGAVLALDQAKTYTQGWTNFKNMARNGGAPALPPFPSAVDTSGITVTVAPGIEERFRALARRIKASAGYTTGIGEDLGIQGDEDTTELTSPVLTVKIVGTDPVVSFKKGKSDGIRLYSRRGSETAFTFLAVDTRSPYVDTRPNLTEGVPEKREYHAFFIVDDAIVGTKSATIDITV